MSVRVDASNSSVIVQCTDCRGWADIADNVPHAYDLAVEHEASVHPESRAAEKNRHQYWKRLATRR